MKLLKAADDRWRHRWRPIARLCVLCLLAAGALLFGGCLDCSELEAIADPDGPDDPDDPIVPIAPVVPVVADPLSLSVTSTVVSGIPNGPTLADHDSFGGSVAGVGDLYNNGGTVIAVGASGDDGGGTSSGAVHLLSYDMDGSLIATDRVGDGALSSLTLEDNDAFGTSVANIGDLYNNGGTVIAVGAFGDDTGGTSNRGAMYLLSYDADGSLIATDKVATDTRGGPALADNDLFGISMTAVGDLYNNGGMIIAVGAFGDDTGGADRGAIYLLSYDATGRHTGTAKVAHDLDPTDTIVNPLLEDSDLFGASIANLGDLYNSGGTVIAVGAFGDDTGGTDRGAVHLLSYDSTGALTRTAKITGETLNGPDLSDNDLFGISIANAGDIDGGGGTVLAVGAEEDDTMGTNHGAIHLLSFDTDGNLTGTTKVTNGTPGGPTLADGDLFGSSIANVGDLDGSGGTVIAVGAERDNTGGTRNLGAIHLLSYQ